MRRLRRPLTLLATILLIVVACPLTGPSRAEAFRAPQNTLWFGSNDATSVTVGPNQAIFASGGLVGVRNCGPDGIDDYFSQTSDVYIVRPGSEVAGGALTEAGGGSPSTIIGAGDAFVDEILGITVPQGTLGPGTYDVVFDACQDGKYNPGIDSVHPDVITMAYPPQLPTYNSFIGDLKAKAQQQETVWYHDEILEQAFQGLTLVLGGTGGAAEKVLLQALLGLSGTAAANPMQVAQLAAANELKHYTAIANDPPDKDYRHPVVLPAVAVTLPTSSDAPVATLEGMAAPQQAENVVSAAFLTALERYQGARIAGDAAWTLIHARELKSLAALLAAAQGRTATAAQSASTAIGSLGDTYATARHNAWQLSVQIQTEGFTGDQVRQLRNLGYSTSQLQRLLVKLPAQLYCFCTPKGEDTDTVGGVEKVLGDLASAESAAATSSAALSGRLDAVISGLTAQHSVPQTAPTADAGGPYTAITGTSITLDASGSAPGRGTSITSYAWDLDGDGSFDDATGATPSVTFGLGSPGFVGLQVTGSDGQTTVSYAPVTLDRGDAPTPAVTPAGGVATATVGVPSTFSVTGSGAVTWSLDGKPIGSGNSYPLTATSAQIGEHDLQATLTGSNRRQASIDWELSVLAADTDGDGWTAGPDCNDNNALVNPGRPEVIGNGIDDDCDPATSDAPLADYTGQAMSWGTDQTAVLGRGVATGTEADKPSNITGLGSVAQVAAGNDLGVAVNTDGTVWTWGTGSGNSWNRPAPVAVPGLTGSGKLGAAGPKATAVSSNKQSAALLADGTVAAWGDNTNGALGTGLAAASATIPALVQTPDGSALHGVTSLSAGGTFLALATKDGDLYVTGGMCGTSDGTSAQQVSGLPGKVIAIAAGTGQLLILLADGDLYGCGTNDHGQLGAGPATITNPQQITLPAGAAHPAQLAAGDGSSLVLDTDGNVWAFGRNDQGQLGLGTTTGTATPTEITIPAGATVAQLVAGGDSAALVRADGSVLQWGHGTDTPTALTLPDGVRIAHLALDTTGTARYAIATRADAVIGWGVFSSGGSGGPGSPGGAPRVLDLPGMRDVATTGWDSVGVTADGSVVSWGNGGDELGGGNTRTGGPVPQPVLDTGGASGSQLRARSVQGFGQAFDVVLDNGTVAVWGDFVGMWQGAGVDTQYYPVVIPDPSGTTPISNVTQAMLLLSGQRFLLTSDGRVWSWYGRGPAQCQPNAPEVTYLPQEVTALGNDNVQIASSQRGAGLFLKKDGSLWSCGNGAAPVGRVVPGGNDGDHEDPNPVLVQGMGPGSVVQVTANLEQALALKTDGTVWAWGYNDSCSVACTPDYSNNNTMIDFPVQVPILSGPPIVSVTACLSADYAIRADGTLLAWGSDMNGGLGVTDPNAIVSPPNGLPFVPKPTVVSIPGNRPVWKIACADLPGPQGGLTGLAIVGNPVAHLADPNQLGIAASVTDASVAEGKTAKVTVSLSHPSGLDLTLHYATSDGSAVAGTDYTSSSGTVTVPAGASSATIDVPTIGNDVTQPDRTFTVILSDPATTYGPAAWASIKDAAAQVTITDDDPAPVVSIAGPAKSIPEGNTGGTVVPFTVALDHPSASPVTVDWASSDGTASEPGDYLPGRGTVTFAPGQTSATVDVVVNADTTPEPDETFAVTLANPADASLGQKSATVTIVDDDPVVVTTSDSSIVSPTTKPGTASFTVSAGQVLTGESVTVPWSVTDGTTTAGDVSGSGTVTLTHAQPTATVEVSVSAAGAAARPHPLFYKLALNTPSDSAGRAVLAEGGTGEITPAPVPVATVAISGAGTVAEGTSLALAATGSGGVPPYTYAWDLDGDGQYDDATGASITHTFPADGTVTVGVQLTDSTGTAATGTHPVTVTDVTPTVAEVPDQSLAAGDVLNVSGSFTDPGADSWTATADYGIGDGPKPLALSGKAFTLDHAYPDAGGYSVTVSVCDHGGKACGSTVFTVTVGTKPPPVPTVAISGAGTVAEGSPLALSASGTGGTGPYTYAWDLDGDGQYDDATGAGISGTFPAHGSVSVGVRLTDAAGKTATATHDLTVTDVAPLVAAIKDQTLTTGEALHVSGSFTDPGVNTWTATVDYGAGDGPRPLTLSGKSFTLEHAYTGPASYPVTVTVCDGAKQCGSSSFTVIAAAPPAIPPTVQITGPSSVPEGSAITLSAAGQQGVGPYSYSWDVDGDGHFGDATGTLSTHTYPKYGTVTVAVRLTDSAGKTASATHQVTIADVAPHLTAIANQALTPGGSLHVSGSFADPGADTWTATVDYGTGPQPLTLSSKGFTLDHSYPDAGSYQVSVQVCDDGAQCGTTSFAVAVTAPSQSPVLTGISPGHGSTGGGTHVVITGRHIVLDPPTIRFAGVPASGVHCTIGTAGDTCTALTPAHAAGTVTVTLTTVDGLTSNPINYTYTTPTTTAPPTTTPPSKAVDSTSTSTGPPLADTGTNVQAPLRWALLALFTGLALALAGRRRRRKDPRP